MDLATIIAAIQKFAPLIIEVADVLHLNALAADLLRKLTAQLVAGAKKTATPIDDIVMGLAAGVLGHIADLLEQGAVKEALALLGALGKLAPAR